MMQRFAYYLIFSLLPILICAQKPIKISLVKSGEPLSFTKIEISPINQVLISDGKGQFLLPRPIKTASYYFFVEAYQIGRYQTLNPGDSILVLDLGIELNEIEVNANRITLNGNGFLQGLHDAVIFEGKKNQVIIPQNTVNTGLNNVRQLFARTPGINAWENDGNGMQINIATRGLSPNRSWEFNIRQNGYDISSDPIGYPESYYNPPIDAVERIEIIKGAGSLQFGPQMGGMVNYELKDGTKSKPLEVESKQTLASYSQFNSFNSLGGTSKNGKVRYYTFYNNRTSLGWRANNRLNAHQAYAKITLAGTSRFKFIAEATYMNYLMQQPGGLTDSMYKANARQSIRERNWLQIGWFVPSVTAVYSINANQQIQLKAAALFGARNSVGNIDDVTKTDPGNARTVLLDKYFYQNNELRYTNHYQLGKFSNILAAGVRFHVGNANRTQGRGSSKSDADFRLDNPSAVENFDFKFPIANAAIFAENLIYLTKKISVTPGFRYEYIDMEAEGYFKQGNLTVTDKQSSRRSIPLFGTSAQWQALDELQVYSSFCQSYRPVTFNDLRLTSPTQQIDPNLKDASGHTTELGIRGRLKGWMNYDISAYRMIYNNRIGTINKSDSVGQAYQYRTNVANSISKGAELFSEINLIKLINKGLEEQLWIFGSVSYNNAWYDDSAKKIVEYAPQWIIRAGLNFTSRNLNANLQYNFISQQFSDASNTLKTTNAVNGIIPSYQIWDFGLSYQLKTVSLSAGINNLLDKRYFSRRAGGYPGPGIIPGDARSLYLGLSFRL